MYQVQCTYPYIIEASHSTLFNLSPSTNLPKPIWTENTHLSHFSSTFGLKFTFPHNLQRVQNIKTRFFIHMWTKPLGKYLLQTGYPTYPTLIVLCWYTHKWTADGGGVLLCKPGRRKTCPFVRLFWVQVPFQRFENLADATPIPTRWLAQSSYGGLNFHLL